MNFQFWMGQHSKEGQRSLEDVINIVGHQLHALGHSVRSDPTHQTLLDGSVGVNIVVEGFTEENVKFFEEFKAKGARWLILATEEPTPKGFNHGLDPEMVRRQAAFPRMAAMSDGVLYLVPGKHVGDWYSQHAPSAYVELGYAPGLVRPKTLLNDYTEPKFDFGFFGSVSKRRLKILKKLAALSGKEHAVRIVGDFATQHDRDKAMAEARVILQIRKFDQMGLVSSSRCNTSLCIGRPVLAEPHDLALSKPWDEIVTFAKTMEGFYNQALIMKSAWRGAHAAQFERFKSILTPQVCVGDALEKIGLLERAGA